MAGPACVLASTPVSTKMPVPMTMPIPKPIRSHEVRLLASPPPPSVPSSFWWMTVWTSLVLVMPVC